MKRDLAAKVEEVEENVSFFLVDGDCTLACIQLHSLVSVFYLSVQCYMLRSVLGFDFMIFISTILVALLAFEFPPLNPIAQI